MFQHGGVMMSDIKIIVEEHADGFVAYPVGLRGVIVGRDDTLDEAVADVTSAIKFHVETFGATELENGSITTNPY
jgi:predicted RNase H-like HicB family nuclease